MQAEQHQMQAEQQQQAEQQHQAPITRLGKFKQLLTRIGFEEKAFQVECFQWCLEKEERGVSIEIHIDSDSDSEVVKKYQINGGILALEMGLGKTVIMLGLIACNIKRHTLIILPLALIEQWKKIIKMHFGHDALVYHGGSARIRQMSHSDIWTHPIVITTYGQISLPSETQIANGRKMSILHDFEWDRIICDEAHNASHRKTNNHQGILSLKARIKWLVTGTPIQNSMKELYSMYDILGVPVSAYREREAAPQIEAEAGAGEAEADPAAPSEAAPSAGAAEADVAPSEAAAVQNHFVYHRTKASVGIRIPSLHQTTTAVPWKNESERIFASHIHSFVDLCHIEKKSVATYITDTEEESANTLRLKYMMRAKKTCIHPPLLTPQIKDFVTLLPSAAAPSAPSASAYSGFNVLDLKYNSDSKMDAFLHTLVARLQNGNGKIVFCHYYDEIDHIETRLNRLCLANPIRIAKFDGRVPQKNRSTVLDAPADVLLAQIKMCREGLNLQEKYSEVYFPLPHFNPAVEEQAIARCWRIGQQKEVHVFRFIMNNPDSNTAYGNGISSDVSESNSNGTTMYSMDSYTRLVQEKKRVIIKKFESANK
jgi:SNF2 family DNA or RNA helicase